MFRYLHKSVLILLACGALFYTSTNAEAQSVPAPSGLIHWWKGEGNANDVIGSNNGTLNNGVTFASGKVGQAFHFDGVNDFVSIAQSIPSSAFTVELWMKSESAQDQLAVPLSQGHTDGTGFALQFRSYNVASLSIVGPGNPRTIGTYASDDLGWRHVAVTHDTDNTNRVYIDGVNVSVRETTAGPVFGTPTEAWTASFNPSDEQFFLGQDFRNGGRFWDGLADEVSIYNRSLSGTEIQSIFNAGSFGKSIVPAPSAIAVFLIGAVPGAAVLLRRRRKA